jgi:hypothetical protein
MEALLVSWKPKRSEGPGGRSSARARADRRADRQTPNEAKATSYALSR